MSLQNGLSALHMEMPEKNTQDRVFGTFSLESGQKGNWDRCRIKKSAECERTGISEIHKGMGLWHVLEYSYS